jgi:hypothetical protein
MGQGNARPISGQNPSEIAIGLFDENRETPLEVIREVAPAGFPSALLHHLADFMARGFNAACNRQPERVLDLSEFAPSPRGRRTDPEIERRGQQAAKLHKEGLTYGQIASRLCPKRQCKGHHCVKKCADRIRQEAKSYETKQELERLGNAEA